MYELIAVSYTHLDVYKRQGHTHTHTIRVISGLTDVYFLTFARFLNEKCRNPTNTMRATRKGVQRGQRCFFVDRWPM